MPNIFISYRQEDSAAFAGRLYDLLSRRFGVDSVFMDVDTIEPGINFADAIQQAVSMCDIVLVLIGHVWLRITDTSGQRYLDDPEDFVRLEIVTALERNIRIIPVLVEETKMPDVDDLPGPLRSLTRRNALQISNTRWSYDIERLIDNIERIPAYAQRRAEEERQRREKAEAAQRHAEEEHSATRLPSDKETAAAPISADVFVSYADEDRILADRVVQVLEDEGHRCWIAHRDIPAGVPSWTRDIVAAIENSRVLVVLVTGHSISSKQVLREVTVADNENIPLIPLRFDNAPLSHDFRYFFASTQRLEMANMPWQQAVQLMGTAVKRQLSTR